MQVCMDCLRALDECACQMESAFSSETTATSSDVSSPAASYEADARAWCIANKIGWCDIHECEYTDHPTGSACAPCGWDAQRILDVLAEHEELTWEEARDQIAEGYRDCEHCGWCKGNCPWSIRCPKCNAPKGVQFGQCVEGSRYVKLHTERWEAARG